MRKTALILCLSLLFASSLNAQTHISGPQNGVWESSGNPYIIVGDTQVEVSDTLTVSEGVLIEFQGDFSFQVEGRCYFMGEVGSEISITGSSEGSFDISGNSVIWNNVRVQGGLAAITVTSGTFEANNCSFDSTSTASIISTSSTLSLSHCDIHLNNADFAEPYFLQSTNGTSNLDNLSFTSNCMGFLQSNGSDLTMIDCNLSYYKDDWYDAQALIFINGGDPVFEANEFDMTVDLSGGENTGTIIRQDFVENGILRDNDFNGTVYSASDSDAGALVGIFGGMGEIVKNNFTIQTDAAAGVTEAEIDIHAIQFFSGEIDSSEIFVDLGDIANETSTISAITGSAGNFDHNLIIVNGKSWSYGIHSSDAEIINNTFITTGDTTTAGYYITISSSTGILKNNIFDGIGTAVSPAFTFDHSYNCYWGYGGGSGIPPLLTGEINFDPQMDATYHLTSISPCINTGDPTSPYDPDATLADMGAFFKDQSDRPQIVDFFPQIFFSAPEHTSQHFWISATDPAGTGLTYEWSYHGEVIATDSLADVFFANAGMDSVKAWVYNSVGSDSQKWVYELTPVNLDLLVPQDFATIQEAIDYSSYLGDTIRIAAGVYYENLVMEEKSIAMFGLEGAENTVIDGSASGSVLKINNSGPDTVMLGSLTFRNGLSESGGGINAVFSTLKIDSCIIFDNVVSSGSNGYGGGIYLKDCWATISDVNIAYNSVEAVEYARGGGFYCDGSFIIRDSEIEHNSILPGATIASGAGLSNYGGSGLVMNSVIRSNELNAVSYAFGGGVKTTNVDFDHVEITENVILSGEYAKGGGAYLTYSTLEHCTVSHNEAPEGAGVFIQLSGVTSVHNSIISFNAGEYQISSTEEYITEINFSNIFALNSELFGNCSPGQGCITVDPLYIGGNPFDYHLWDTSPCIDVGDPASPLDPNNTRADLGCYYFDGLPMSETDLIDIPQEYALLPPFPNPFNRTATLDFQLPVEANVELMIYNSLGRIVTTLLDRQISAGYHSIIWDAALQSSGIYFLVLRADDYHHSQKLLLLK
ncbi:MAG: T9SS type A sorting domain-containing protein [bacterium]